MSKGLEAIRQYKQFTCQFCQYHYDNQCNNEDECFSMIIEKELKAFEIIKKHKLLNPYQNAKLRKMYNLSDEEWKSLKEVL